MPRFSISLNVLIVSPTFGILLISQELKRLKAMVTFIARPWLEWLMIQENGQKKKIL
jgi:hypothetical protein